MKAAGHYVVTVIIAAAYEARTHQVDCVSACPTQVEHRRTLDISMTCVRHAVLRVQFKKYYFSARTRVGHN